jgi:hypothetical protein
MADLHILPRFRLATAEFGAREQMASATPEQTKAGMEAWMRWAKKAEQAIVDLGLGEVRNIGGPSDSRSGAKIVGYSILLGESMNAVTELVRDHPQASISNFSNPGLRMSAIAWRGREATLTGSMKRNAIPPLGAVQLLFCLGRATSASIFVLIERFAQISYKPHKLRIIEFY